MLKMGNPVILRYFFLVSSVCMYACMYVCMYVCFRFKMADRAGVFSSRLVRSIILDRSSVVAAAVNADKVFSYEDMCSCLGYFK